MGVTNLHQKYLDLQNEYTKKYGEKCIVLMQVGSFHEAYATEKQGYDLYKLASLLNMVCTKKNKSISNISIDNPLMLGFPSVAKTKYIKILVDNGFTVVVLDQISQSPHIKREVTGIYSPGTYIDNPNSPDNNNIIAFYIEQELQTTQKLLTCIGMTVIDLSTGDIYVNEVYSFDTDNNYAFSEALRFLYTFNPKEIVIYHKIHNFANELTKEKIIYHLEIINQNYHYFNNYHKQYEKISYQQNLLNRVFHHNSLTDIIQQLDLDKYSYLRISLIGLIDFVYQHDNSIILDLNAPKFFSNHNHLILGNNAVMQLAVIDNHNLDIGNSNVKSLFDTVNFTKTALGRRFLKNRLTNPITQTIELQKSYNFIDELLNDELYLKIQSELKPILDIERLYRKLLLLRLQPFELAQLITSYQQIKSLIKHIKKNDVLCNILPQNFKQINKFLKESSEIFNFEILKSQNLTDITQSFFNSNLYSDIDKIQNEINFNSKFPDELCSVLSNYINDSNFIKKKLSNKTFDNIDSNLNSDWGSDLNSDSYLKVKKHETKDGLSLLLTQSRFKQLERKLKDITHITVLEKNISVADFNFKTLKGTTKITLPCLDDTHKIIGILTDKLKQLVSDIYLKTLNEIKTNYANIFKNTNNFISEIDFLSSSACCAKTYKYIKPVIQPISNNHSYINARNLRHPIIERIIDYNYVPHDVNIGQDLKGMLIYGINSCGKSSLMKSVGLNVILAQSGMFVAATDFIFYPYNSIYARITGTDNIFKGQSSFTLEMIEINSILNKSDMNTLIIGDEPAKGTENLSANALVASAIICLAKLNASFIFATHLHDIPKLKQISCLDNVKTFHLSVEYDAAQDLLIFNRELKSGQGDPIYGITVANKIVKYPTFITIANQIKNDLLHLSNHVIPHKTSKYNAKLYLNKCSMCNKEYEYNDSEHTSNLDTHHIIHQASYRNNNLIPEQQHILKNQLSNLVTLCKDCHQKIHNDKLDIAGSVMTSNGKKIKLTKDTNYFAK